MSVWYALGLRQALENGEESLSKWIKKYYNDYEYELSYERRTILEVNEINVEIVVYHNNEITINIKRNDDILYSHTAFFDSVDDIDLNFGRLVEQINNLIK